MLEQMLEQRETLQYELYELKQENETQCSLLLNKTEQLKEWENLMHMMKEDKDRALLDLEETEQREQHWRNELEFLMNSLHEALNERDSLREEMFKLTEKDCSSRDEINRMKKKVEEIINEKGRMENELLQLEDQVQMAMEEKENNKKNCKTAKILNVKQSFI